jgi:Arc/MetJ family transcription regulator
MPTNLALDDRLIEEARAIGGHSTKREAVNAALAEYVGRRRRLRVRELFGTVEWEPGWDWKAARGERT